MITTVDAPRVPGLSSKEYYNDDDLVAKYTDTIAHVLENLLEEAKRSSMIVQSSHKDMLVMSAKLVHDLVELESKLAEATPDEEDAEDVTKYYNPKTLEEAESLLPQLSISEIVAHLAPSGCHPQKLIIASPAYLQAVFRVLKSTSTETLQAYFVWKVVQAYSSKIEDKALKPLKRFNNIQLGKDPDAVEERWRTCIKNADNSLGKSEPSIVLRSY